MFMLLLHVCCRVRAVGCGDCGYGVCLRRRRREKKKKKKKKVLVVSCSDNMLFSAISRFRASEIMCISWVPANPPSHDFSLGVMQGTFTDFNFDPLRHWESVHDMTLLANHR